MKHTFEKRQVAMPAPLLAIDLKDPPCGPGMHGRVHIAQRPFIGRQLPIRMQVPDTGQEHELIFRKLRVDDGNGDAVKGQIPGCVPGIFSGIRHGQNVGIIEVAPLRVPAMAAFVRRGRLSRIAASHSGTS